MRVLYTGDILSGDKIGMATKVLATDHHRTKEGEREIKREREREGERGRERERCRIWLLN